MTYPRIVFLPRSVAALWQPLEGSVLISIHDKSEPPLDPQPGWADVLFLRFHDTDGQSLGLEVFNQAQAQQVLDFAARHAEVQELVVHCHMGHSRSAAIALFLAELRGVPCFQEQTSVDFAKWPRYNRKVYAVMAETCFGPVGSAFGTREE